MKYDVTTPLDLVDLLRNSDLETRREFTRRAAMMGMSGGVLAGLLAACGGTSTAPTNTPGAGGTQAVPTTGTIPTVVVNQSAAPAGSAAAPATVGGECRDGGQPDNRGVRFGQEAEAGRDVHHDGASGRDEPQPRRRGADRLVRAHLQHP